MCSSCCVSDAARLSGEQRSSVSTLQLSVRGPLSRRLFLGRLDKAASVCQLPRSPAVTTYGWRSSPRNVVMTLTQILSVDRLYSCQHRSGSKGASSTIASQTPTVTGGTSQHQHSKRFEQWGRTQPSQMKEQNPLQHNPS